MMIEEERSMKKLIATALALTMTLSLSTTALAGGNVDGAGVGSQYRIDVTAKYNDSATKPTVYSVDLTWEDMTFTYNESGTKIWDPDTHTYTGTTSAGWDKFTAAVTATNHSNANVKVSFTYTPQGDTDVTAYMSKLSFILAAGVENYPDDASTNSSALTIDGNSRPNGSVTAEGVTIGTITVTIE